MPKSFFFTVTGVTGVTWREAVPERVGRGDAWQVETDLPHPTSPTRKLRRYQVALAGDKPWEPSSVEDFPGAVPSTARAIGAGLLRDAVRAKVAGMSKVNGQTVAPLPPYTTTTVHDSGGPRTLWLIEVPDVDTVDGHMVTE
jgi:hypothetical protein